MSDRITANLPSRNLSATASFYAALGFTVDYRDDQWMILSRGSLEIEFFPYPDLDPATSSFSACVRVDDLDRLHAIWSAANLPGEGIPRLQGPPWVIADDLRMFAIIDCDGSLLRCIGD